MVDFHEFTPTRILLTGASGFLGRAIARQCVDVGLTLRCTGRSATPPGPLPDYVSADLTSSMHLEQIAKDCDVLLHSAGLAHQFGTSGKDPADFQRVNVVGTQNAVKGAIEAGVKHVVLVSSVSVYGPATDGLVTEATACQPESPYAASKLYAELAAAQLCEPAGVPLTILRMATIYGEGDPGNVARLMSAIDRRRFVWIGRGANQKSLVHVDDAAAACIRAATRPGAGLRTYNVSASPCSMRDVVDSISTALEKPVLPLQIPASIPLGVAGIAKSVTAAGSLPDRVHRTLEKWIADDAYDGSRFCNDFEFSPLVSLEEGIRREADWFRQRAA